MNLPPFRLSYRQGLAVGGALGFARSARRLAPPLTATGAPAQKVITQLLTQLLCSSTSGSENTEFLTLPKRVAASINQVLRTQPEAGTHWSVRKVAVHTGISKSTVARYFALFGLQPHRSKSLKLSADPFFIEKVRDVVGLYLNPPDKALVLSVDEKSQIQALERTQPVSGMSKE